MLLHIVDNARWSAALIEGTYTPPGFDRDGFIHLSAPHQVLRPANLLYRGRTDLSLLVIDESALPPAALAWERGSHGEDEDFPHLYAPLPVMAVQRVLAFPCAADGSFVLPTGVSAGMGEERP